MSDRLGHPVGWRRTTLGEALPIRYGKARSEKYGTVRGNTPVYGSSGRIDTFNRALTSGPSLIIGRKGTVGATYYSHEPCWPIDTVYFTEATTDEDLRFFKYLLDYLQLARMDRSTAVPGLSRDDYNTTETFIPDLDQQRLIVAEIEKQFSRLDEGLTNLKRVRANLKRYKAAVLKAAVEGKLTEDWRKAHPDVEPASKLLERILAERRAKWEHNELAGMKSQRESPKSEKWKNRYKEADPPISQETYGIPETWTWTNLGQLSWSVKDGPHYSPKYSDTGVPFISGGNVRPQGIDFSTAKYISPKVYTELSERCKPEYHDLLYTKGGTTGIARINTDKREFSVWVHVAVLKLVDSINRFYLQHALNSPHCYRQSQKYTHGVGNQDLGLTRMIWITVALPPLEEQDQIVAEVERRLSVVLELEAAVDTNLKRADRLRQSVLSSAFSGELVETDKVPESSHRQACLLAQ